MIYPLIIDDFYSDAYSFALGTFIGVLLSPVRVSCDAKRFSGSLKRRRRSAAHEVFGKELVRSVDPGYVAPAEGNGGHRLSHHQPAERSAELQLRGERIYFVAEMM